jgi:hypothetical protein
MPHFNPDVFTQIKIFAAEAGSTVVFVWWVANNVWREVRPKHGAIIRYMATQPKPSPDAVRDYRMYYVRCPEVPYHFILADPQSPRWEKTPPFSPIVHPCRGCGPNHPVQITELWKVGYVSSEERNQLLALSEPCAEPKPS